MIKEIYTVLTNCNHGKLSLENLIQYFNILLMCGYDLDTLIENVADMPNHNDEITKLSKILVGADNSYGIVDNKIISIKIPPEIMTYTGKVFDFVNPTSSMIDIIDIARGLSKTCRFNGHCSQFYSVAQHSVIASYHVPLKYQLQALLHDSSEAYLGDVVTPLKQLLPEYKQIEEYVEAIIFKKFGLPEKLDPIVKDIDSKMFCVEFDLLIDKPNKFSDYYKVDDSIKITEWWDNERSYQEFMTRFNELYKE